MTSFTENTSRRWGPSPAARATSSDIQEHGFMLNFEEIKQDEKKRMVFFFVMNKKFRKIVIHRKDMVITRP